MEGEGDGGVIHCSPLTIPPHKNKNHRNGGGVWVAHRPLSIMPL